MAIDRITAVEAEIDRLTTEINRRKALYGNDILSDAEYKDWLTDIGLVFVFKIDLQKLNQERDSRLHG
ncbi:unnamed protein product [Rotaria socialis]|uniref:Uncharacterized protein n=1 Tax=Rotaria socialis TaxID=392032 RepID=A0A820FP25_9BILA|nr:unnamed protein product [Rotaria socialis]CAF4484679.1 unnamed protein product [Rotaria socialis]CAF4525271.1 unnamed protein product [Rotaria socialis]CAF4569960.1 unnamed protein product [Rotaria socialis]